jgi:carbon storage regulator CsrA
MLVLSRRNDESVIVGASDGLAPIVKVTVLEINGGRVSLGFEVSQHLPVHRWEVWERIRANARADRPTNGRAAPKDDGDRKENPCGRGQRPARGRAAPDEDWHRRKDDGGQIRPAEGPAVSVGKFGSW